MNAEPRILFDRLMFPEGPRWHQGQLWVSDQHAHKVWAVGLDGAAEVKAQLDDMPSGLGFLPDGSALVVEMRTQRVLRIQLDGTLTVHADFSQLREGWLNEMVVDGRGNAYVHHSRGRPGIQAFLEEPSQIMLVAPDGEFRVAAEEIYGPNGTAVTPDNRTLIMTESANRQLIAFDIAGDGSLLNRRTWAPDLRPDGICLDAEGAVWLGSPYTREFLRVREGGEILQRVPVEHLAIACALGGPQRTTLFMCVTDMRLDFIRHADEPGRERESGSRGRIETLEVAVRGAGWP